MTIGNLVRPLTIATAMMAMAIGHAVAGGASIFQSTLAEANQRTEEVNTEQLRRILADGRPDAVDARLRNESVIAAGGDPCRQHRHFGRLH